MRKLWSRLTDRVGLTKPRLPQRIEPTFDDARMHARTDRLIEQRQAHNVITAEARAGKAGRVAQKDRDAP